MDDNDGWYAEDRKGNPLTYTQVALRSKSPETSKLENNGIILQVALL